MEAGYLNWDLKVSFIARASLGRTGAKPPRADLGLGVVRVITPSTAQNTVIDRPLGGSPI